MDAGNSESQRNPPWSRDELILALDLYTRSGRTQLPADSPEVVALSDLLNRLSVHPPGVRHERFRNPNGVSMKLGNFSALDPQYGGKGLMALGKLDVEIWDEFSEAPYRLRAAAEAIRTATLVAEPTPLYIPDDEEFSEGRILTRLHKQRERRPDKVREKKRQVLDREGKLACESCGFDFFDQYGELGFGFAECHHRLPLAALAGSQMLRLVDLAILCANCHRMIHRSSYKGAMMSVEELRGLVDAWRNQRSEG